MKVVIIGLIAVTIIGGGAYLALHKSPTKPTAQTSSTEHMTQKSDTITTITFDGNRFTPASLSVKAGTVVTIKNVSSHELQMNSNPHPVHTDDTDLNVGMVSARQSQAFTVTKTGSFGYHDHLDPGIQGKITIE